MMQTEHVLTLASGGQGPHEALANCRSIIEVVRMRAMCDPDKRALMFLKDGADDIEQWTYGELSGAGLPASRGISISWEPPANAQSCCTSQVLNTSPRSWDRYRRAPLP